MTIPGDPRGVFDKLLLFWLHLFSIFAIFMSSKGLLVVNVARNMPKAEDILNREIARVNLHLPATRPTLGQLLSSEEPKVRLRDGTYHHFKRSELEYLLSIIDPGEEERLRLPIVLEISTLYRGYFRVRGKVEVKVIDKVLDMYDILEEKSEGLYPRYLLPKIRRRLPTTTTYAFITE